ncbi:flagellar hook-basal body complex protein FliE [Edaphobacter sp. HDX4]|uniref:flagellar hook-basal body complex protein FliE n=1 Tax=Edaphobacter sp. HDX4 TaxID=2794064 RepID=UPI002FE64C0E
MNDVLMKSTVSTTDGFASLASRGVSADRNADTPFSGLLQSMIQQTGELDHQAAATVSGVLSGQGVDIHQAMIATQKADMAFELALQVRNKAVGAYQQMMGMQF